MSLRIEKAAWTKSEGDFKFAPWEFAHDLQCLPLCPAVLKTGHHVNNEWTQGRSPYAVAVIS